MSGNEEMSEEAGASNDGTASRQVMLICSGIGIVLYSLFGVAPLFVGYHVGLEMLPWLLVTLPLIPVLVVVYLIIAVVRRAKAPIIAGGLTLAAKVGLFSSMFVSGLAEYAEPMFEFLAFVPLVGLIAMLMAAWYLPTRPNVRECA
ncbi:hypothetical protein ACFORJ_10220 [Corynebacterium hansenii]|uniref:Uncharacterized protein n=1 Tax=Corynebacterium hansenii TaxID=394964 RepID=A0ABV7ZQX6_9CORY|nr:hypothetical protein [Corynebacterium hansenii]WJZ01129.1 hypothetical protein CHAN_12725 [Corynebacterium hansenii]